MISPLALASFRRQKFARVLDRFARYQSGEFSKCVFSHTDCEVRRRDPKSLSQRQRLFTLNVAKPIVDRLARRAAA
jgi:hypothetical protein